jgi:hypothetical protein
MLRNMSFLEIEAELEHLSPEELRRLAMKSWKAFVQKETQAHDGNECTEEDPELLVALDEAIREADDNPHAGRSATEVRALLSKWTSK